MIAEIAIVLGGAGCGGFGRHLQGGAGPRWLAMLVYAGVLVPLVLTVDGWEDGARAALLAGAWYAAMTMHEEYGSLWLGAARYALPGLFLALFTFGQAWWGVPAGLVAWGAMAWARKPHEGVEDPHAVFEWVEGAVYGGSWAAVALLQG